MPFRDRPMNPFPDNNLFSFPCLIKRSMLSHFYIFVQSHNGFISNLATPCTVLKRSRPRRTILLYPQLFRHRSNALLWMTPVKRSLKGLPQFIRC